jgi:hypothetical protein
MATERRRQTSDHIPYSDELDPPTDGSDDVPLITAEDIAHLVERLEAGRDSGEYSGMRESDLAVLAHLNVEQWQEVIRNPSMLPRLVVPTAHA